MRATTFIDFTRLPVLRRVFFFTCALLLQACGGGGSDAGSSGGTAPAVSGVGADRTSYGLLSTFTVIGSNLTPGVTFGATGCGGLAVTAGGSSTKQVFTCTPNGAPGVRVGASAAGSEFYNATLPVPRPRVTLTTTLGPIVVELDPAKVKATVDNFLTYVNSGFYNGTIFHRVVKDFVSQGGGFTGLSGGILTPQMGVRAAIPLETNKGLSNLRGSIAMARTSVPDSATSQFFFNQVDNTFLDYSNSTSPGYAVFGTIVSGLSVMDAINGVSTQTVGGFTNVPVVDIVLQSAARTQ